ncbi:LOW QUALITY PROTEIN: thiamine transporter 2-like [Erpetoichthys calabaricus]|uniref:LOW QUALITY PROTEIN: thiamine transporter 2-like n=1 Tax=Erpetoichthys calabaricus TaxID=27687 RepID=UPI0010A05EA4|nr:LOW QUALITY PROTEIN: thiamine transporter 2-like [Erpetoichthys calabaricus]
MNCWRQHNWVHPTLLLCSYGFFSMMRPSEPFLTPYLTGPYKNLTVNQVSRQVYPVWTYSNFVILVPIFLVTDYLRYKPVIVLQGLGYIITWLLLLFAPGVLAMQFMQFTYGIVTASEVGYYSYIYSVVSLEYYTKVTSYCRSVTLVGYTVGSVLGQLLVSLAKVSYYDLNIISLVSVTIAFFISFWLPMPQRSLFFHKSVTSLKTADSKQTGELSNDLNKANITADSNQGIGDLLLKRALQLWDDFKICYSSVALIYYSLWWALATCGYYQVANYVQVLWKDKEPARNVTVYNGAVEAVATLTGAASSFIIGHVKIDWSTWGEFALGLFSVVDAAALYVMEVTTNIWICYAGYVVFKSSYMQLITICTFQIATNISMERYALMFGINNFVALTLQTILTAVVIDTKSIHLSITQQYFIYGCFFSTIAAIFLIRGIYILINKKCVCQRTDINNNVIAIVTESSQITSL